MKLDRRSYVLAEKDAQEPVDVRPKAAGNDDPELASALNPPVHLFAWRLAEADSALCACCRAIGKSSQAAELSRQSQQGLDTDPHLTLREMLWHARI
jgi:hypothetical protein